LGSLALVLGKFNLPVIGSLRADDGWQNDGTIADVKTRAAQENAAWPYSWHKDSNGHQSRGSISGKISLSDGRPASGAAVFLGDNHPKANATTLDQGKLYYYRVYADHTGAFKINHVRSGKYNLQAWPNGGAIGDVTTVFSLNDVSVGPGAENRLANLIWKPQNRKPIWQIGSMDRKAIGFKHGGSPRNNDIHKECPSTLKYVVGKSRVSDWCFAQWDAGKWSIEFAIASVPTAGAASPPAVLSVSLAAYTTAKSTSVLVNGAKIGSLYSPKFSGDPAIVRSATLAGEWRYIELQVPTGVLKMGKNVVDINMAKVNGLNGYIYDSLLLEWA
jgi:rhamnogalacturonan endolyase